MHALHLCGEFEKENEDVIIYWRNLASSTDWKDYYQNLKKLSQISIEISRAIRRQKLICSNQIDLIGPGFNQTIQNK